MKVSSQITTFGVLNINMLKDNKIIMLSIPTQENIKDLPVGEILYSRFEDDKFIESGVKSLEEIFNLFSHD
jgi:hypothetical protein